MTRSRKTKKQDAISSKQNMKKQSTKQYTNVEKSNSIQKKQLTSNYGHYGESSSLSSDDENKLWAAELENVNFTYKEPSLSSLDISSISKFLQDSKIFIRGDTKISDCISIETLEMLSIMTEINLLALLKLKNEELLEFLSVYKNYHMQEVQSKDFPSLSNTGPPKDLQLVFMSMPESGETLISKLEEYYSEFSKVLKHPFNKDLYTCHELKKVFTSGLALDDLRSEANRMYFEDFQEIFGWAYNKLISLERRKEAQETNYIISKPFNTCADYKNTDARDINEKSYKCYSQKRLTTELSPPKNLSNRFNGTNKKSLNSKNNMRRYENSYLPGESSIEKNHNVKCVKCSGYGHFGFECTVCLPQKVSSNNDAHQFVLEKEYDRHKKSVSFDKSTLERMLVRG